MELSPLKKTIYAIAVLGFLSCLFIPDYSLIAVGLFIIVLIPSWFMVLKKEPFAGYTKAWNIASILFLFFTLAILLLRLKPTHIIFTYQISFLQVSKAFNRKRPRDILWMWFYAFLMLLIAAIFTRNPLFPVALFFFLVSTIYALFWLGVYRDLEYMERLHSDSLKTSTHLIPMQNQGEPSAVNSPKYLKASRRSALFASALSVVLTSAIFLIIPRITPNGYSSSFSAFNDSDRQKLYTGFSTGINLGSLHDLTQDATPVINVKISGSKISEGDLYLRGGTFDLFTGSAWLKSQNARAYKLFGLDPKAQNIMLVAEIPRQQSLIRQEITYLDYPSRYVFALPGLAILRIEENETGGYVYKDKSETCFLLPPQNLKKYVAYSMAGFHPEPPNDFDIESSQEPLLQLPAAMNIKKISELAEHVSARSLTDYEKARRIESFLVNEYRYTLRMGSLRSDRPIEDFLFVHKAGHCELFSTAMICMLRTLQIPCRLAVGFHGGEFNRAENSYIIRQCDAHAWVEMYDEQLGWMRFDPTPPAPMTIYASRIYFKKISDMAMALSEKWEEFIMGYNNRLQTALIKKFFEYFKIKGERFVPSIFERVINGRAAKRFSKNLKFPFVWIISGIIISLNFAAIAVYLRLKRRGKSSPVQWKWLSRNRKILALYCDFARALGGDAGDRPRNITPQEYLLNLGQTVGLPIALIQEGCDMFYALRYNTKENTDKTQNRLNDLIEYLRKTPRK